jgi:hypothetical protein
MVLDRPKTSRYPLNAYSRGAHIRHSIHSYVLRPTRRSLREGIGAARTRAIADTPARRELTRYVLLVERRGNGRTE